MFEEEADFGCSVLDRRQSSEFCFVMFYVRSECFVAAAQACVGQELVCVRLIIFHPDVEP